MTSGLTIHPAPPEPSLAPGGDTSTGTRTDISITWNGPPPGPAEHKRIATDTVAAITGRPQGKALTGPPAEYATDGVMLALYPDAATTAALVQRGGTPGDELHLTVGYLGSVRDTLLGPLIRAATDCLARAPIAGQIAGHARFTGGDRDVLVALFDSPALETLRRDVCTYLDLHGLTLNREHGYTPHLTLGYLDPTDTTWLERLEARPATFTALSVVHGSTRIDLPFLGDPPPEPADVAEVVVYAEPDGEDRDPWLDVKSKPLPGGRSEAELAKPHPYRRHPNSGAGNCECGATEKDPTHAEAKTAAPLSTGAFVSLGGCKGRVDLVVTNGTVPAAKSLTGHDVQGTAAAPAARVVEYGPSGTGTYAPTGHKFAAPAAAVHPIPPLRTREAKSLEEALAWAALAHGTQAGGPDADTLRRVYTRGLKSHPGPAVTTLSAEQWALGRVDAFAATCAGLRPPGYHADDDLLATGGTTR